MTDALSPGRQLRLTIDSVAYRGAGVARHDGHVVFVPGVLAGEIVLARIKRLRKRYAEAVLVAVEEVSPDRQPSDCQVPGAPDFQVPGCVYAHMTPEAERRVKQQQVADFMVRGGFCETTRILPLVPSPASLHYRNKIVLHVGRDAQGAALGYVTDDNRSIADLPACPLANAAINARLAEIRNAQTFQARLSGHDSLTLRFTERDGVVDWWDRPDPLAPPLQEMSPIGTLSVPRDAFFQVNPPVAAALVEQVTEWLRAIQPRAVLDLFCGVGVFALAAAALGIDPVLGADHNRGAIDAARANAKALGVAVRFLATDAGSVLRTHLPRLTAAGLAVVLDPPRSGLDRPVLDVLCETRPETLIYIACAPDMLARDLGRLRETGYAVRAIRPFDMFPRTHAIETAAWLQRD